MANYARIESGIVVELFTPPDGVPIEECFVPELAQAFVLVPDNLAVEQNWTYDGTTFSAPIPAVVSPQFAAAQELATRIAAGIVITSSSTPALNAIYALDAASTAQIFQIGLYAKQFDFFPSGDTTQPYPDSTGVPHVFTVPQFVDLLQKVAPLVSALNTQAQKMANGVTPAWPSQSATIA